MNTNPCLRKFQKGIATLIITVIILVIVSLMVFFATRVGLLDQRMAGNEVRYKEAFAMADGGLDFATQRFNSEFRRGYDGANAAASLSTVLASITNMPDCDGIDQWGDGNLLDGPIKADGTCPQSGESSFTFKIEPTTDCFPVTSPCPDPYNPNSIPIYTFKSTGIGADGTGTATVQRQVTMSYALGGGKHDIPLVVSGGVGTGGDFNIVANPNAAGPGIPVSVWTGPAGSGADVTMNGSSATCHIEFYQGYNAQCSNPSGILENISWGSNPAIVNSAYNSTYPDVLPNDSNFPSDLFAYLFGIPRADWLTKRNEAEVNGQSVTDCSQINALGDAAGANYTLWWVTGNCALAGIIGSTAQPVVLVIDDGELTTRGNTTINGIAYLFDNPDTAGAPSTQLNGTTQILGSFISDVGGSAMQGSYAVVWDSNVNDSFTYGSGINFTLAYIPASWRDFQ